MSLRETAIFKSSRKIPKCTNAYFSFSRFHPKILFYLCAMPSWNEMLKQLFKLSTKSHYRFEVRNLWITRCLSNIDARLSTQAKIIRFKITIFRKVRWEEEHQINNQTFCTSTCSQKMEKVWNLIWSVFTSSFYAFSKHDPLDALEHWSHFKGKTNRRIRLVSNLQCM